MIKRKKGMRTCIVAILLVFCIASGCSLADATDGDRIREREIKSEAIEKLSAGMTFQEIKKELGRTYYYFDEHQAPNFFSYIVDGSMRYTQTFANWDDICELSGKELLETIKEENTEIPPRFADTAAAREEMKSAIFGSRGWVMLFANESYAYATYGEYGEYIFRYNIRQNTIDRALDVSGLQRFSMEAMPMYYFTPDGRHLVFRNQNNWILGKPATKRLRLPFAATYIYEIDFEESRISLLTKDHENWVVPEEYAYPPRFESAYRYDYPSFYKGSELLQLTAFDVERVDSESMAAIKDGVFAVMLRPSDEIAGNLGYYSFAVIDVANDALLSVCAVNPEP
ncbi:MAG: hypothetical protein LBS36_03290 [Oscillospiraceae bacterium]|nr:hypothetical protein [Oscillospiraceae bacterium]